MADYSTPFFNRGPSVPVLLTALFLFLHTAFPAFSAGAGTDGARSRADTRECISMDSISFTYLTSPEEIAAAPVRINSAGQAFECTFPEFCSPVDIFIILVSPDGHVYFPDSKNQLSSTLQPFRTITSGGFSEVIDSSGVLPETGLWEILWLIRDSQSLWTAYSFSGYQAELRSNLTQSSIAYNSNPAVSSQDMDTLAADLLSFTLDFYHQAVSHENGKNSNVFFSAYSIENALAMTWAGAKNSTADQMADSMHITLEPDIFHSCLNALNIDLNSRDDQKPVTGDAFQFNLVNAVWTRIGYPLLPSFLDILKQNYNAGVRQVDFFNEPHACRQLINRWVEDQTHDRIKDLLPENAIQASTALVLTNAVYFNASWFFPFDEKLTAAGNFTGLDGAITTARMMTRNMNVPYYQGRTFDVVDLPYVSAMFDEYQYPEEMSMLIIIPEQGQFQSVEAGVDTDFIDGILSALSFGEVDLRLPTFEFEFEIPCRDIMENLGMIDAFIPGTADFTGLVDPHESEPWIDEIYHKAFVKVDEEGTEAAAATAVVMRETAIPDPVTITADRPFIFLIRDKITGAVLFMGRVIVPSDGS